MNVFYGFCFVFCIPVVCCSCAFPLSCDQLLWCGGSCLYVTVLYVLWMWQGFPWALVMLTNMSSPTVAVLWQNTLLLFGVCSPNPQCAYWKKARNISLRVCVSVCLCVCVCLGVCASDCYVWASAYMQPRVPAQTSGWSVLIILKLLHNAIKHYNYHKLNIQNTHWRICGLGVLSSRGVLEMMGLGDVWRGTGRGMISREMVNHLGKETQGKNKARRKCTCQTEQQRLASSSTSYVITLWSADLQVRRVKRERRFYSSTVFY